MTKQNIADIIAKTYQEYEQSNCYPEVLEENLDNIAIKIAKLGNPDLTACFCEQICGGRYD